MPADPALANGGQGTTDPDPKRGGCQGHTTMINPKLAAPFVAAALLATAAMPMVRAFAAEPTAGAQVQAPLATTDPAENAAMTGTAMPKTDMPNGEAAEARQEAAASGTTEIRTGAQPDGTLQQAGQDATSQYGLPFPIAKDAAFGLREVRAAQIALRAGDTANAKRLVEDAQKRFAAAEAWAITPDQLPSGMRGSLQATGKFFPVGAQIMIAEDISASPQKAQAMNEAAGHMRTGNHAAAREVLRVNEVDVATILALLPADQTVDRIVQALSAIDSDPANAAQVLASIERGVIVEGLGLRAMPGGAPSTDAATTGSIAPGVSASGTAPLVPGTPETTDSGTDN